MSFQFHVLASGSSGNACVLEAGGFGVLIDFGLSPRQLAPRMHRCRVSWQRIHAVLLTHAHTDHWRPASVTQFARLGLPVYCHRAHLDHLNLESRAFKALLSAQLIRHYESGEPLQLQPEIQCLPIELAHDGVMTCGFRFEGPDWALGYAADLGSWRPALAKLLCDVDLLALEFNHDVTMQLNSGRSPMLIRRVLGDHGHLSNEQAANLLTEILNRSQPGRLRHLVQLHLSRDCNRPELAHAAARQALEKLGLELAILTAHQDHTGTTIDLREPATVATRSQTSRRAAFMQAMLPFAE